MSSPEPAAAPSAGPRPDPPRLLRITAAVAAAGVALALIGLALLLRPVTTPVQDCGTTLAFVLDGRVDQFADPDDPPDGLTADEVVAANANPCRSRVADAAKPGLTLVAVGMVVAVGALVAEVAVRANGWRRRRATTRR